MPRRTPVLALLLLLCTPVLAHADEAPPGAEDAPADDAPAEGKSNADESAALQGRKPVLALLPSISFNGDDGLGLGVFGDT